MLCVSDALTQQPGTAMNDFAFAQTVPDQTGGVGRNESDLVNES